MKNVITGFGLILLLGGCVTIRSLDKPVYAKKNEPWTELPESIKRGAGDCMPFAVMVNNRRAGITPNVVITQEEWDKVKGILKTDDSGTEPTELLNYYKALGYTATVGLEPKTCSEYSTEINLLGMGCVVFRHMYDVGGGGHVEALTAGFSFDSKCFAIANSWGRRAVVKGFSKTGHDHTYWKEYSGLNVKIVDLVFCPTK